VTPPLTVRSATRRFVVLTALRWFPVGLTVPVMVLLATARGVSLPELGLLLTAYGVVVLALELPTGGLADVVGRRPVVLLGVALHALSCTAFVLAEGAPGFLLAFVLHGIGRALDSGPVEAWYVDTVRRLDPTADVAPGLAAHSAADGGSLAVGAALGGMIPLLLGGGTAALAAPFVAAIAVDLVYAAAVVRLLTEDRPPREGSLRRELANGVRAVPATTAGAVRLALSDGPFRLVLALTAVGGVGLVAFELLAPLRLVELTGDPGRGAAAFGTVQAVSFATAAGAALAGPWLRQRLRGSTRATCALLAGIGAAGALGFGVADAVVVAGAAMCGFYVAHGATWPLLSAVMHGRVTSAHRSTAVSAVSLALSVGGITGNLVLPRLAEATSLQTAFLAVGALVLLSAALCLRLPPLSGRPAQSQSTVTVVP
jgi:predicted MFS family arabinose efflux permease